MSDTSTLLEQRIRERAYRLWEEAGRAEGMDQHFWFRAEQEILASEARLDTALADTFPASDPPSETAGPRHS